MTNEQYTAKNWLMRLTDYAAKVDAERRTLEMLQHRLYRGVAHYDGPGRHDPDAARAAHETALLDFSEQAARVEKAQKAYMAELEITREILETLPTYLRPLAIDRYINGQKWKELEKIYPYSIAELYRQNNEILEHVAEILNAKPTKLIITQNKAQQAAAV